MKAEKTVDYHIKNVWYAISRMYNTSAARLDLSMAAGYVLLNIDKNGTPATKIAPLLGLEPHSLTRMLKTLEEKGWIYRQLDEHDKRVVNVFLTEEGKQKRDIARQEVLRFNALMYQRIGEEKLRVFFDTMKEIQRVVDAENNSLRTKRN